MTFERKTNFSVPAPGYYFTTARRKTGFLVLLILVELICAAFLYNKEPIASTASDLRTLTPEPIRASAAVPSLPAERNIRSVAIDTSFGVPSKEDIKRAKIQSQVFNSPEYQKYLTQTQKNNIRLKYGILFQILDLQGDERARLEQVLLDRLSAPNDFNASVGSFDPSSPLNTPAFYRAALAKVKDDIATRLKATVGEDGMAVLTNYDKNEPVYDFLSSLQSEMGMDGIVLSNLQITAMATTLQSAGGANMKSSIVPAVDSDAANLILNGREYIQLKKGKTKLLSTGEVAISYLPTDETLKSVSALLSPGQQKKLSQLISRVVLRRKMAEALGIR